MALAKTWLQNNCLGAQNQYRNSFRNALLKVPRHELITCTCLGPSPSQEAFPRWLNPPPSPLQLWAICVPWSRKWLLSCQNWWIHSFGLISQIATKKLYASCYHCIELHFSILSLPLIYFELKIFSSNWFSVFATIHAIAASPVTLTDVLIMSSTLSTARMIPIAWSGKLNCCKIIIKVMVPADGTAAVPMEVATAKSTTWIYWNVLETVLRSSTISIFLFLTFQIEWGQMAQSRMNCGGGELRHVEGKQVQEAGGGNNTTALIKSKFHVW